MILTAYFDESGTHGDSAVMTMAGVLASAKQWTRFQRDMDRLKRKHRFRVLHTNQFKRRTGEFKGWTPLRSVALLDDLADITVGRLMDAVTIALERWRYNAEYRAGATPKRPRLDTAYALCFRQCLYYFLSEIARRLGEHSKFSETKLHAVLESGHRHAGDAVRAFHELQKEIAELGSGGSLLESITFADKGRCDPLMVADFLAHTTLMRKTDARMTMIAARAPSVAVGDPHGVTHLEFSPNGLSTLRTMLAEQLRRGGSEKEKE